MGYLVSNFKVHFVFQGVQYNYVPGLKVHIELSATFNAGLSEPGVPRHPQTLTDQLTLTQPAGADYAHLITATPPPTTVCSNGFYEDI